MNKNALEKMTSIVRDEIRKGRIGEFESSFLKITSLYDAAEVDIGKIQRVIRKTISENNNPLNVLFGLFGLKVVSNDCIEKVSTVDTCLKNYVTINEAVYSERVSEIGTLFADVNEKNKEQIESLVQQVNELRSEKEQLEKEISSIKTKYNEETTDTIKSLQDIWGMDYAAGNSQAVSEIEGLAQDYGYRIIKEPDSKDDKRFVFQNVDTIKDSYHAVKSTVDGVYIAKPAMVGNEETVKGYAYVIK